MTTVLIKPEPPNMSVFSRLNAVHTARTLLYKGTSPDDVVEALLDCGADLNDVDDNGNNILHLFSHWRPSCSKRICKKIIAKINNVNERNNGGDTAFLYAARYGHTNMLISLMNHPDIELNYQHPKTMESALHEAVQYNRPKNVTALLNDDRVDWRLKDKYNDTPLNMAINHKKKWCVKPFHRFKTPYELAVVMYNNTKDECGNPLPTLHGAIRKKDDKSVNALLDHGYDPNEVEKPCKYHRNPPGRTALIMAANYGCSIDLFNRILSLTHNINARDRSGWTALIHAVRWKGENIAISLINHPDIDLSIRYDGDQRTVLHLAVEVNSPTIVEQLLRNDMAYTSFGLEVRRSSLEWANSLEWDGVNVGECQKILRAHGATV